MTKKQIEDYRDYLREERDYSLEKRDNETDEKRRAMLNGQASAYTYALMELDNILNN